MNSAVIRSIFWFGHLLRPSLIFAVAATAIVLGPLSVQAQAPSRAPPSRARCLKLEVFIRGDSQPCRDAVKVAKAFVDSRDGICLRIHDVKESKERLSEFWQLMRKYGVQSPRVPAFLACGQLKLGFLDEVKCREDIASLFTIHAYVRSTCQHCRAAKQFLGPLVYRWPALQLVVHDVDREPGAMQKIRELAQRRGIAAPSLPTIFLCGQIISGYQTDATTGRQIEQLLLGASSETPRNESTPPRSEYRETPNTTQRHRQSGQSSFLLSAVTFGIIDSPFVVSEATSDEETDLPPDDQSLSDDTLIELPMPDESTASPDQTYVAPVEAPEGIELPWVGYVRVRDWGLPIFTLLIGLIDGFNPCAMWVLVFLLSVLVNIKDRKKIAAIAFTFVIVSGLAYYAFMAAWLNLFMLVGIARPIQIVLGLLAIAIGAINVKDFFAFKQGITLSIPEAAKPGIYARVRQIVTTQYLSIAIGFSIVLAVLVNVVELLCTAGLPAVYTQILSLQQLPAWQNYAYLALYIVAYMLDDGLMVSVFVVTLSHRKMREGEGRWLKLISGLVVLGLGGALLFRPNWLQW